MESVRRHDRFLHRGRLWPLLLAACLVLPAVAGAENGTASPVTPDAAREAAVKLARDGRHDEAIERLQSLMATYPDDAPVVHDLITVLGWAGRDRDAWALRDDIDVATAPPWTLATLARAGRNLSHHERAARVYRELAARFPDRPDGWAGQLLALTDAGELPRARAVLREVPRDVRFSAEVQFARGYLHERAGENVHAIDAYRRALEADPQRRDAFRRLVRMASGYGAPGRAAEIADRHPDWLDAEARARVRADRAALLVRWGELPVHDPRRRFEGTDRAIEALRENLETARARGAGWPPLADLARFDLMVALRDRVRMQDVVTLHEELVDAGTDVPAYALEAAADAYLYLEQPRRAGELYREVLARGPADDFQARMGLFYALVEQERHDQAQEVIDALAEDLPRLRANPAAGVYRGGDQRLAAEVGAALARLFADRLPEAAERLAKLGDAAPFNPSLRAERANLYRSRGWPRLALEEARIGLSTAPRHLGLRLNEAAALLDLDLVAAARTTADELYDIYPENKGVQRLAERLDAHDRPFLSLRARRGRADGVELGSTSRNLELDLYTSPLRERWRGWILGKSEAAEFEEGRAFHDRLGAGLQYRAAGVTVRGALTRSRYGERRTGALLELDVRHNDHWSYGAGVESLAATTPLRALREGIRARTARVSVAWQAHESRSAGGTVQYSDFTDGNERAELFSFWRERWRSGPVYKLDTVTEVAASDNTRADTPYFNPDRDLTVAVTAENRWLTWRRYQRSFEQSLYFTAGSYRQQDFASGPVWAARYAHRWSRENRFEIRYGIGWSSRLFDGDREEEVTLHFEIDTSF